MKSRLVSRYIYEHLFLAHLFFDDLDPRTYFRLVRSRTPPGEPIDIIATRRPTDDPGVGRVYYRVQHYPASIVAKTHMPYALSAKRMQRWRELFLQADYEVTSLPGYDAELSANPFAVFFDLPLTSRYRFMLEEAQYTVMGFIKGPVCRGQVALNVINDYFWVFFVDPDVIQPDNVSEFYRDNMDLLTLPSGIGSTLRPVQNWNRFSRLQREYLEKKDEFLALQATRQASIDTTHFWDGDGINDNAALTIFRHIDSATVEKGLLGDGPKTAWLLGYTDLERIHYLLVAGYDVYGNLGHQLLSRLYMDFLRMDGESNFLLFLPRDARDRERQLWYRDADPKILEYLTSPRAEERVSGMEIPYRTDDPKRELYAMLRQSLEDVLPRDRALSSLGNTQLASELDRLNDLVGDRAQHAPQNALLMVETPAGDEFFSILRNNAHLNMTSLFREQKNRAPAEDRLQVLRGFVGSYPNAFYKVGHVRAGDLVAALENISDDADYEDFMDRFGVRRTDADFWSHSDRVHRGYRKMEPQAFGLLDYNRLENR